MIEIINLCKSFNSHVVLDNLIVAIPATPGNYVNGIQGIQGPTGATGSPSVFDVTVSPYSADSTGAVDCSAGVQDAVTAVYFSRSFSFPSPMRYFRTGCCRGRLSQPPPALIGPP